MSIVPDHILRICEKIEVDITEAVEVLNWFMYKKGIPTKLEVPICRNLGMIEASMYQMECSKILQSFNSVCIKILNNEI